MTIFKRAGISDFSKASPEQPKALVNEIYDEKEMSVFSLRDHPLTLQDGGAQLVSAPSKVDFDSKEFREALEYNDIPNDTQAAYYKEVE